MITGSFQKAFWTLTQECPIQNDASTIRPKRMEVSCCFNPLTPVPPVTAHDEPWPFLHFWHHHFWPKLASSILNFRRRKRSFRWCTQWSAYWNLKYAQKCSKSWAKNSEPNFLPLHLAAPWLKLATSMTLPETFFNLKQAWEKANHSSKEKPWG